MSKQKKTKVVELKLEYPVVWGEETIEVLTFKRPTGADIEHLDAKPNVKQLLQIGAKIACVPPGVIKKMDASDCFKVVEVVGDFLGGSQETGDSV